MYIIINHNNLYLYNINDTNNMCILCETTLEKVKSIIISNSRRLRVCAIS